MVDFPCGCDSNLSLSLLPRNGDGGFEVMQWSFAAPSPTPPAATVAMGVHTWMVMAEVDLYSFGTVLCACAGLAAARHGQETSKKMPVRNLISWNSMIFGFAQNGKGFAEDSAFWVALPGACTTSTNSIVTERIAMKMMELDPDYYLSYVLLANVYRAVGRWDDAVNIRKPMEERGVKKKLPGKSWIDINSTR
ncbi:hypothetical protein RJ639_034562 [Escallonia herrerae]|uniref:Pentatricopeptide repeat-containing protein n=1 Tax=Escallonia herrerae TaxID=1293975 RepID=A0AA88WYR4_9ASTE|nr:hypothetical protein RJ639_034562 [Escallonia herrerae]